MILKLIAKFCTLVILFHMALTVASFAQPSCVSCGAASHFDISSSPAPTASPCTGLPIDFGTVDPGLTMITKLKLTNCTSSLIKVEPALSISSGPASQWDFTSLFAAVDAQGEFDLPGDAVDQEYEIRFQPSVPSITQYSATLTLTFEDTNNGTVVYSYTFRGFCNTIALNAVLVLDRSGSMGSPAYSSGTITKIAALQRAASLFYDALRPGDNFGVVKYNSTADNYIPIAPRTATLPVELEPSAITEMSKLQPMGSTAIGKGLELGVTMLSASAPQPTRKNIIVLQTDGIQNVFSPAAEDVTFPASINVYTVGLGPDVQDGLLQTISSNSGVETGFLKVDDEIAADQKLEAFYVKVLSQAHNGSMVVDPTQLIDLTNPDTIRAFTAAITSSDIEAEFLIIDEPSQERFYSFDLVNPKGEVVDNGSVIGGAPVEVIKRFNYSLYRVNGRNLADSLANEFRGEWKVIVKVKGGCTLNDSGVGCQIPITFLAGVKSNLKLELTSTSETYLPGAPIVITVEANESTLPINNFTTTVRIKTPRNKYYSVALNDNGIDGDGKKGDGIFSGTFAATASAGTYEVYASSTILNRKRELTTREEVRYVSVLFPQQKSNPSKEPFCIPCVWQIIILVLVLILLLFIIYRITRRSSS